MSETKEVTLNPGALKRLARLQARVEGANQVAQAAMMSAQQAQMSLQQALTEECQDEGMVIPMGGTAQADIDWRSGVVRLRETGVAAPVPPPEPIETDGARNSAF